MTLICPICKQLWSSCGAEYHRKYCNKIDYKCKCGNKRKPVEKESLKIIDADEEVLKRVSDSLTKEQILDINKSFCLEKLKSFESDKELSVDLASGKEEVFDGVELEWEEDKLTQETVKFRDKLAAETFAEGFYYHPSEDDSEISAPKFNKIENRNILVIADTHEPFSLNGYREFCYGVYKKYNCNHVIHLGDLIDSHFSSYHETSPDGLGGKDELSAARRRVREWAKMFPRVDICTGNHDRIIMRKAMTGGIPSAWIKNFNEVLGINWNWNSSFYYDNVVYRHGVNSIGSTSTLNEGCSIVQGHAHSMSRIIDKVGQGGAVFGFQIGSGIDHNSYAMLYSEKKPVIGCGVVLENGRLPIRELMEL